MASTAEVAAMMAAVLAVIRERVEDEAVLARIVADVDALMSWPGKESEN